MKSDQIEKTLREYERWLRKYTWQWFATLKMSRGIPTDESARRVCKDWITELKRVDGGDDFRWFCVFEKGRTGNNRHFHVLIGGLRSQQGEAQRRWRYLGGDAVIEKYDPSRNAVLYMLKTMDAEGNCDIDFNLPHQPGTLAEAPDTIRNIVEKRDRGGKALVRVGNLPRNISARQLWKMFSRFAGVSAVRIHSDKSQTSALIEVERDEAPEAVRLLDQTRWGERLLTVEVALEESSW